MSKQEEGSLLQLLKDLPTQIATALGLKQTEVKLGSIMTEDGELKIEFDGEVMMVGGRVWITAEDGTEVPVPVGDHVLENGNTLVVKEEGLVDSFIAPQEEVKEEVKEEVEMAQPENNDAKIASEIESAIKSILIKYTEQNKEIAELKLKVEELGKQPSSKGIKQPEFQVDLSKLRPVERFRATK